MALRRTSFWALAASLLSGCSPEPSWQERTSIEPVWASNDEFLALDVFEYEVRIYEDDDDRSDTRRERSSIFVVRRSSPAELGGAALVSREGWVTEARDLFLMHEAGYLAAIWLEADHPQRDVEVLVHELTTGEARAIDIPVEAGRLHAACFPFVVPSPGGDHIAAGSQCITGIVEIAVFAYPSLQRVWGPETIATPRKPRWTTDGRMLLRESSEEPDPRTLIWTPGDPEAVWDPDFPECGGPPTTSSPIAADGTTVLGTDDLDDPVEFGAELLLPLGYEPGPFGCP